MAGWIVTNASTIIISLIILVLAGLALRFVYRRRKSKDGCGGQCGFCHGCSPDHKARL